MGQVYKAKDTRLDRIVAIKVLHPHIAEDTSARARFEREARTVSALDHPHICTLYDVGEQDDVAFLVMEFLEGETLANRLKKGALPLEEALLVAARLADGLDAGHRAGVVHRDFKPGNIMLTARGAKDHGLRAGEVPIVSRSIGRRPIRVADGGQASHQGGRDSRDLPVHGSRAARSEKHRRSNGHLRLRCGGLRDADRAESVRR